MIFHNPWGLLALLALPAILALHFFRSRRRPRLVGGLHLWEFAALRRPVGRRFERLMRSLPLLLQLLAALLLALLVAGIDLPHQTSRPHYTLILDDSASMQATDESGLSDAELARRALGEFINDGALYTAIAAGARPRILAGPFAEPEALRRALADWRPAAPLCQLEAALNLATKFNPEGGPILFFGDDATPARPFAEALAVQATGRSLDNSALTFADRVRVSPGLDRIVLSVEHFGRIRHETELTLATGETELLRRPLALEPGSALNLQFEVPETERPVTIALPSDALAADNRIVLAPLAPRQVRVFVEGAGEAAPFFRRAAEAVPRCAWTVDAEAAELVFSTNPAYRLRGRNLRLCLLHAEAPATATLAAEGRDILANREHPATRRIDLEGLIWAYLPRLPGAAALPPVDSPRALLSTLGAPLLTWEDLGWEARYRLNLLLDRGNLFRQPAWPVLFQGMVEECRDALPGPDRANYPLGQALRLRLPALDEGRYRLLHGDTTVQDFARPPREWTGLGVGAYTVLGPDEAPLGRFRVHFQAPAESDLRPRQAAQIDPETLRAARVERSESMHLLYYGILLALAATMASLWILSDRSR